MPSRRDILKGAIAGAALGGVGINMVGRKSARVTQLAATTYDEVTPERLADAISSYPETLEKLRGSRVLLKPNLVEFSPTRPINTEVRLVAATVKALRSLGAGEVLVGEAPGHRRDLERLLHASGMLEQLDPLGIDFIDLNVDDSVRLPLPGNYSELGEIAVARSVVEADLVISMPKAKTHHWAGATASMKNLFGAIPGRVYGWPKNPLHWAGIEASIIDLWQAIAPGFAIVDGVVAMEGDGPLMGSARQLGAVVMGDSLCAVDSTVVRLMGLDPLKIPYLRAAAGLGGELFPEQIEIVGDPIARVDFEVLDGWSHLRLA